MTDADAERRRRLVKAWRQRDRMVAALEAKGMDPWNVARYLPPFPADLIGLACGAKTRAGTPCKLTSIYCNGRCKLHGGLSTGPKTPEGKAKAARNGAKRQRTP